MQAAFSQDSAWSETYDIAMLQQQQVLFLPE